MSLRVFVTGASGYVGSAVAARLARAGHEVYGLTRHPERLSALAALGIRPVPGDLADRDSFLGTLQNCDAAVHAALDAAGGEAAQDQMALEAFRAAAQDGRIRRLLYTSGAWVHGDRHGAITDESSPIAPLPLVNWRAAHEEVALDLSEFEVSTVILRSTIVYGESRGIIGAMWAEARDRRRVTYPGDGSQIWSLVHRDDVAEAYALAIEHAPVGARYLLADDQPLPVREIAEAIARTTGAEATPWAREEVLESLGPYGEALLSGARVSAARARRELGWVPRHASFANEADALYREWQTSQGTPVA
jgi:nucleoside-diphosphate-sugar epimerase